MNATGTRTTIIVSPYGTRHAPRRAFDGKFVRRYGYWLTLCGQIAERGWSQRVAYGYVDCRNCLKMLDREEVMSKQTGT